MNKKPKPFLAVSSWQYHIFLASIQVFLQPCFKNNVLFLYQQWNLFPKKIIIHCQWFAFFPLQIPSSQILAGFYWCTQGWSAQTWGQQLFTRSEVRALLALHIRDNYVYIKLMIQYFEPYSSSRCKFMAFTRHNISWIYVSKDRIWLVICMHLI